MTERSAAESVREGAAESDSQRCGRLEEILCYLHRCIIAVAACEPCRLFDGCNVRFELCVDSACSAGDNNAEIFFCKRFYESSLSFCELFASLAVDEQDRLTCCGG